MAQEETNIVNTIMMDVSPMGVRMFRNVRGLFYTKDSVEGLIRAVMTMNTGMIRQAINALRKVSGGLSAPGSSDLIGFKVIVITPEMVGQTIAVFTAIEVKTESGRVKPDQKHFIEFVQKNGGLSGVARSAEDARKILNITT